MYGRRLKQARKKANMSQEEIAEILNISRSNISKYENEELEPNIQILKAFCKIYGTSADYIIGLTNKEPTETTKNININQSHSKKPVVNIKE